MATRTERAAATLPQPARQPQPQARPQARPARPWRLRLGLDASQAASLAAAVALLVLFAAYHLVRLDAVPGWDPQEGYNLDIAWNLLHGRLRLFGLSAAFGQHPPLFYLQLALLIHLFGYRMAVLRALVAGYAILTCAATLGFGWQALGRRAALWAGLVLTGAPLFLANTRWGYSYAQLMFLGVGCLWALWLYTQRRSTAWLVLAGALAGLCVLSDYEGIAFVVIVLFVAWRAGRGPLLRAALPTLGIPLAGLIACLAVAPGLFLADAATTFGRASGSSLALGAILLLVNYYRFASLDVWILLGLAGLFVAGVQARRWLLLGSFAVLALVVLKVREVGPSFHTAVPLIPYLALGAGVALDTALRQLYAGTLRALGQAPDSPHATDAAPLADRPAASRIPAPLRRLVRGRGRTSLAALVVFLVVVSPLGIALASDAAGLASTLTTRNDAAVATSPTDAQAVAAYVLAHARPGDLTLGSPQVVWQLDQPDDPAGHPRPLYAADVLQALAATGRDAAFYPAHLPADRWAFDVSLPHARYVIVDNLIRELASPAEVPGLAPLLAQAERWPIVFRQGEYTVYQRPR